MEAVMEGTPHGVEADYWVGWAFYFVRKYLAETTTPHDPKDDPQSGYLDSVEGSYVTPGQATVQGKLIVYDLNNAEWFDRGRRVYVPDGGDNFKEGIIIHKAIVGDPGDPNNYPGCVLINTAMFKVHVTMIHTGATKNIGMGLWPSRSGHDNDPKTPDWLYSYPASTLGIKGVHFPKWYVSEFNDEGMPLKMADKPSMGLNGTIVDMNLAIKGQVPYVLHAINAVNIIDVDHYGASGVPREEGLIFASTDPVALDLLGARYMFKNLPADFNSPSMFARTLPFPRYDKTSGAIVTDQGVEDRVSRATLFEYAAKRGLGSLRYYVEGKDETTTVPSPLVSKDGHFGRLDDGKFVEIMTDELFYSRGNNFYDLQPPVLALAQATDTLSGSNYYKQFMALDEDGNGIIDDSERGKKGFEDCSHRVVGIGFSLLGKGEPEHMGFFINSRLMKYADPAWNVGAVDSTKVLWDAQAFTFAWRMAIDEENEGIDPFFGIPYGAVDGKSKWPSLQYARHKLDISTIHGGMYATAAAYSKRTGKPFKLYVPRKVPYAPPSPPGEQPWSYNPDKTPHIVELDPTDPNYSKLVFTADFGDETW
jgi:hypothetical protein